jgi:hypothetical protein
MKGEGGGTERLRLPRAVLLLRSGDRSMPGDVGADPGPALTGFSGDGTASTTGSSPPPAGVLPRDGVKEAGEGEEAAAAALLMRSRMAADDVPVLVRFLIR